MKKKKIITVILIIIILFSIGVSYAYFSLNIKGNSKNKNANIKMNNISLSFNDNSNDINDSDLRPGWIYQKKVTVTNTGDVPVTYDLVWKELENEIEKDEMVYSIECLNCNKEEQVVPFGIYENKLITTNTINKEESQEYIINFKFKEKDENQNYNENKIFKGIFGIKENGEYNEKSSLYKKVEEDTLRENHALLYTGNGSDTYKNKVYFYNGPADTNNVLFANNCWKILRTTETGGIKLIYNGKYNEDTKCDNSGTATEIGRSAFNASSECLACVGYMYNNKQYASNFAASNGVLYGNDVEYKDGNYHLIDTSLTKDNTHHYTCNNTTGICDQVIYYYYQNMHFKLINAQKIDDKLNEIFYADNVNKNDSTIKEFIDNWYENNMLDYTSFLEDTTFCNDRRMAPEVAGQNGMYKDGNINQAYIWLAGAYATNLTDYKTANSNYLCINETDSFRVNNPKAKLKYPIGIITQSEALFAGISSQANDSFLKSGSFWWLNAPLDINYGTHPRIRRITANGTFWQDRATFVAGVRPSVSLKKGTMYINGDGKVDNPYIVK